MRRCCTCRSSSARSSKSVRALRARDSRGERRSGSQARPPPLRRPPCGHRMVACQTGSKAVIMVGPEAGRTFFANVTMRSARRRSCFARPTVVWMRSCSISCVTMVLSHGGAQGGIEARGCAPPAARGERGAGLGNAAQRTARRSAAPLLPLHALAHRSMAFLCATSRPSFTLCTMAAAASAHWARGGAANATDRRRRSEAVMPAQFWSQT